MRVDGAELPAESSIGPAEPRVVPKLLPTSSDAGHRPLELMRVHGLPKTWQTLV